jgi:hypothetical protein
MAFVSSMYGKAHETYGSEYYVGGEEVFIPHVAHTDSHLWFLGVI